MNTVSVCCRDRIGDCGARIEGKELQRGCVVSGDCKPRGKRGFCRLEMQLCQEKRKFEGDSQIDSVGKVGEEN